MLGGSPASVATGTQPCAVSDLRADQSIGKA